MARTNDVARDVARELTRLARKVLATEKVAFRYQDIGHGTGSLIWWVDNKGKLETFKSTGREFHHELDPNLDMDARWRGRIDKGSKTVTMMPPLREYQKEVEEMNIPGWLMSALEKLGGKAFVVDSTQGMKRISKMKKMPVR